MSRVSLSCHQLVHKYICEHFTFLLWNTIVYADIRVYVEMRRVLVQEMLGKWPKQVTHIIIGDEFKEPVINLPSTVTTLETSPLFNQPIHSLPPRLTHLILGNSFNQPLHNLPQTLTYLDIGNKFYRNVDALPAKITHLNIGYGFYMPFQCLPPKLQILRIKDQNNFGDKQQKLLRNKKKKQQSPYKNNTGFAKSRSEKTIKPEKINRARNSCTIM